MEGLLCVKIYSEQALSTQVTEKLQPAGGSLFSGGERKSMRCQCAMLGTVPEGPGACVCGRAELRGSEASPTDLGQVHLGL